MAGLHGVKRRRRQAALVSIIAAFGLMLVGRVRQVDAAERQRYLALGDSYTIGQSVAERERWPVQLVARLRQRGVEMADPEIVAQTGWTTADLLAGIDAARPYGPFTLVSLLIGVNNQFQGRDLEEYRRELRVLLQRAIGFAGDDASRVLVLSIPDWSVTPFAAGNDRVRIAADLERFNRVCREESTQAGVRYVDITATSQRAAAERGLLARDGLHPSGKMYAAWVELALAAVGDATRPGSQTPARTP